ncbi:unnamed protein product [Rotaria sordida]|uniref:VWFA domain-containing protein n=1 Tax=Rotaria sordida TaxID=392033 RepID=A0A815GRE4_9BILA|nr:unnamed protein product [Rotaria sordida]
MTSTITMEKVARPELAKHESSILDLVFVMDCTGSMGSYIASATNNIRSIVEEIVVSEKSDIRLALVEYRDHPPQDHTFVTRVHDFTAKFSEMKCWLQECQASGGGDGPEAVADGLHAVLKLSWRAESTKICILIADAPPHGLDPSGDGFPNGCPDGLDPVQIVREMAKKQITLYSVGVEPPITPYRDFFMSLAYTTGGQYIPMINAKLLAKVIIGGVREEISLDRLMQAAEEDINREMKRAEAEGADDKEKVKRINDIFTTNNLFSTQMANPFGVTSCTAKVYSSTCQNMAEMQHAFVSAPRATSSVFATTSTAPFTFGPPSAAPGLFGSSTSPAAAPVVGPTAFTFGTSSTAAPQPTSFTFGPPSAASTVSIFGTSSTAAPQPTSFTFGSPSAASTTFTFGTSSTAAPQPTSFGFGTSTASFGVDGAASTARAEADMTYDVIENAAVNEDQAERIYQKWQQRKK